MKKQIITNIFSSYIGRAVGLALGFLIVPFLIAKLGVEMYGVIVLAETLSRFIELVSGSIRMALARHATFALGQNNVDDFTEYLSTGRAILFVAAGIVFCLGMAFSFMVPHVFNLPSNHADECRYLFMFFIVAFTISFPNMVYWSSLYAKQRFDLLNFASTSGLIIRAVLVLVLFSVLPERYINLTTYGFIFLAVVWADNFLVYIWSRRILPDIRIRLSRFNREKVRHIFWFGAFTTIHYSAGVVYENVVQIIINMLWGPRFNAIYSIAAKFPIAMKRLFVEPAWALTPTFTDLVAKNDQDRIKALFFMYSKAILVLSLPLVLVLAWLSDSIIEVWVGPDFAVAAVMMSILMMPLLFSMPLAVSSCLFNAYDKVKVPSLVSVLAVTVELVLGVVLAKFFAMGLMGISMAESLIALAATFFFSVPYSCRISGLSQREFWMKAFLPPLVWGVPVTAIGILIYRSLHGSALEVSSMILLLIAAWGLLYSAGAYKFALNSSDRNYIRSMLRNLAGRLGLVKP